MLMIFMKTPALGLVKTRLAKSLCDEKALEIYKNLVKNVIEKTARTNTKYDVCIFLAERSEIEHVKEWLNIKAPIYIQNGSDLGGRMHNAFKTIYELEYDKAIIIGADIPGINSEIIHNGFIALNENDVIIGPTYDGGYYLIGLKKPVRIIFENIDWSTDRVLEQTIDKIEKNNMKYNLLDKLRDIDTLEDLKCEGFGYNSGP